MVTLDKHISPCWPQLNEVILYGSTTMNKNLHPIESSLYGIIVVADHTNRTFGKQCAEEG